MMIDHKQLAEILAFELADVIKNVYEYGYFAGLEDGRAESWNQNGNPDA